MAIADQIRDLTARILDDLFRASDYYTHTEMAWRLVQGSARDQQSMIVENLDTGSRIDARGLAALSQNYVAEYLAESVFQRYVSLLEDYVLGLIGCWLVEYPRGIVGLDDDQGDDHLRRAEKTIPLSFVVDHPDRESILRAVVDRELDRLKYRRLAAWFEYLEKRARLGTPSRDEIERLAEIKASRDVLVHNRGIVNQTYLSKAGPRARHAEGARVEIIDPYLRESWRLIGDVVRMTSTVAISKVESRPITGRSRLEIR